MICCNQICIFYVPGKLKIKYDSQEFRFYR